MLENNYEHDGFFESALAIKGSVTPKVINKVLLVILYASLISCLNYLYPTLTLPIGPLEYGGLIMGLILVFRVNAGYDRWWEARKLWGNVVNHSRNLAIILNQYSDSKSSSAWVNKICGYIMAFPWLMKSHLRQHYDLKHVRDFFDEETYHTLCHANDPVHILSTLIAKELHTARTTHMLDPFVFLRAEETRSLLVDALGGCERILKTPMPFVMAVKSRRFILFFLLMLPLGLIHISNLWISPIISGLVAYALLALDQIGVELQNPFSNKNLSHLPLDKICQTITQDIFYMLEKNIEFVVEKQKPQQHFEKMTS